MTNREKYTNEILDIASKGEVLAVDKSNHKPVGCDDLQGCEDCLFYEKDNEMCNDRKWWLNSEYVDYVDWSKVAVDTPILVSDDAKFKKWEKGYFAKYEHSLIYVFSDGKTSWTTSRKANDITNWKYAKLATESDLKNQI